MKDTFLQTIKKQSIMSKIGSMSLYYSVGMLIIQYAHSSTVERKLAQLDNVLTAFDNVKDQVDSKLFLYQTPDMQWVPSTVYRYEDFRESLDVMATEGVAGKTFYVGEDVGANGYVYGLINIAAFLAHAPRTRRAHHAHTHTHTHTQVQPWSSKCSWASSKPSTAVDAPWRWKFSSCFRSSSLVDRLTLEFKEDEELGKEEYSKVKAIIREMITKAIPKDLRTEEVQKRYEDPTEVMMMIMVKYQPGSRKEKEALLQQIQSPEAC
jgi:hypothetical protein